MLSHVAYMTRDTAATTDFYTRLLGMELVNAVLDDSIPSTGEPVPVLPFVLPDGRWLDGRLLRGPRAAAARGPAAPRLRHVPASGPPGRQPGGRRPVDEWLEVNGVEVLGPVDHKIIYSIYFHDPNGIRLEITAPTSPAWNDNAEHAAAQLADWSDGERAGPPVRRRHGRPCSHQLASERSHRRS